MNRSEAVDNAYRIRRMDLVSGAGHFMLAGVLVAIPNLCEDFNQELLYIASGSIALSGIAKIGYAVSVSRLIVSSIDNEIHDQENSTNI